jgi:hypothetical protein
MLPSTNTLLHLLLLLQWLPWPLLQCLQCRQWLMHMRRLCC